MLEVERHEGGARLENAEQPDDCAGRAVDAEGDRLAAADAELRAADARAGWRRAFSSP